MDAALAEPEIAALCERHGKGLVREAAREAFEGLRRELLKKEADAPGPTVGWKERVKACAEVMSAPPLLRVINATGILLHTNLGRAPLGAFQKEAALAALEGYAALEYDLEDGRRGDRSEQCARWIRRVTGAESAVVTNNNAAAVTLILRGLSQGKEVIVSRGELIEIGGQFRIPEIMEESGAVLREVGCTNRTRAADYERAISENTGAILKVHTSNYRIQGFTEEASLEELTALGKKYDLPVIVDLGSGILVNLEKYGLPHEPTVQEILKKGADLVCFSGDKLLGGPQAGIIAGKERYVRRLENHPLMRTFRADKCTIAVLAATFREYLDEEQAVKNIPVLAMLTRATEELKAQAEQLCKALDPCGTDWTCEVKSSISMTGGGAFPGEEFPSAAVVITPKGKSCQELSRELRRLPVPVIAYIKGEKLWLDMRTVSAEEAKELQAELCAFFGGCL